MRGGQKFEQQHHPGRVLRRKQHRHPTLAVSGVDADDETVSDSVDVSGTATANTQVQVTLDGEAIELVLRAIEAAGYGAILPDEAPEAEDTEQAARQAEIKDQTRKFMHYSGFASSSGESSLHELENRKPADQEDRKDNTEPIEVLVDER